MTAKKPHWLLEHASNVFSQTGEDGVVHAALAILPNRDRWCVEFGAWDGRLFSNTANLILNEGYSAVLIEGDPDKFNKLQQNFAHRSDVITIRNFVSHRGENTLDAILGTTPILLDFDFLSIDIDGNDYHVWDAVTKYTPKIVCIEFNPTIPTEVSFIQEKSPRVTHGTSLTALAELGKRKGYELICVLPFNAIFVRRDLFPLFEISDNRPCVLRTDTSHVTYLFSGYDGTIFLSGSCKMPWHGLSLDASRFQVLPSWARQYPENYSQFQKRAFNLLRRLRLFQ